jgi:hypothetical protein
MIGADRAATLLLGCAADGGQPSDTSKEAVVDKRHRPRGEAFEQRLRGGWR